MSDKVFPIFQRYNFESKSQLVVVANLTNRRCFRYFKDTILKANHNYIKIASKQQTGVTDISKIQNILYFSILIINYHRTGASDAH